MQITEIKLWKIFSSSEVQLNSKIGKKGQVSLNFELNTFICKLFEGFSFQSSNQFLFERMVRISVAIVLAKMINIEITSSFGVIEQ